MNLSKKQKDVVFGVLLVVLILSFFLVKFQSPQWIKSLYDNDSFGMLNRITSAEGQQSLDFYLGKAEDSLFGPLSILISMVFFLIFALRFFKGCRLWQFALAVFVFLVITKADVLSFPPYGELVAGPYAEATWLSNNSFDYVGLANEKNFSQGGPKVYLTSIYPTIAAFLMKISPTPMIFIVLNHLLIFILAAFVLAILREILLKLYDHETAILVVGALLSLPIFQCMTEMLHMEMLGIFFAMFSAYFLIKRKIELASVMAILSAWSKGTGGFTCVAVLVVGCTLFFMEKKQRGNWRYLLWGVLSVVFGFMKLLFWRMFIHKIQPAANALSLFAGISPLWEIAKAELLLFIASLILVAFLYLREKCNDVTQDVLFIKKHYVAFVMFIFAGMWFGLFINVSVMAYRYELFLMPFLVFCLFFVVNILTRSKNIIYWLLIASVVVFSLGSYGMFHFKKYPSSIYSYHKFERSLEYRNDLKLHMRLAKEIEERFSGFTIGAPFVIAQKLALANLGYVKKPMDVVIYGMPCTYGGIKNFQGLKAMDIRKTIWIGFPDSNILGDVPYPVDPKDKVLKKIVVGDKEVVLFMGGIAIEKMRLLVEMSRRGSFK